ncbi:MAG: 6-bladed beta-propeller [Nitrospirae bacterium]|nr:6-bladed beta-propeller [Nitrospirota bacterium]
MFRNCHRSLRVLGAALLLAALGCAPAAQGPVFDPFTLFWPMPPEKPRVKYYDSLTGEADVKGARKMSLGDVIFGAPEVEFNLRKPYGVATDSEGRVYVSDVGGIVVFDKKNGNMRMIGNTGAIRLVRPLGLFIDKKNSLLYVTDGALDRCYAFTLDGKVIREFGQKNELKDPGGVVVDTERNLVFITNTKNHVVSVFDTEGKFIKNLGARGKEPGEFNFPTQIAIDNLGRIYVVDSGNFRVQIIDQDGKPIKEFGSIGMRHGQFARPKGIAVSPEGILFISDAMTHGMTVFDTDGTLLLTWGVRGWEKGMIDLPAGVHVDDKGLVYVVSQWTAKVDIFQYLTYPEDKDLKTRDKK